MAPLAAPGWTEVYGHADQVGSVVRIHGKHDPEPELKGYAAALVEGEDEGEWHRTTAGRVLFNSIIPEAIGFINKTFGKKELGDLVFDCFTEVGLSRTTAFLDSLKDFGFRYATMGGISVGIEDTADLLADFGAALA